VGTSARSGDRTGSARSYGPAIAYSTHTVVPSPIGLLTLVCSDGALTGLHMDGERHRPPVERFGERDESMPLLVEAARQLTAYFAGRLIDFDLPIWLQGTPFQRHVWAALADIPYGETVSYGELAAQIGQPSAARAVGLANGRNPVAVIVPCHRVVGSTGSLVGYGGGLDRKRYLLRLEQRRRPD
jgi:methylated-DNA-[protein]-cysteine S-methyltransferase